MGFLLSLLLLAYTFAGPTACASAAVLSLEHPQPGPIGLYAGYLEEEHGRLTLNEAVSAYEGGRYTPSRHAVLNFGIGSRPV